MKTITSNKSILSIAFGIGFAALSLAPTDAQGQPASASGEAGASDSAKSGSQGSTTRYELGSVFPIMSRDDALRGPAYGANSVSSSQSYLTIKQSVEGILISASQGKPTADESAAYHNMAVIVNDYGRIAGTVPYVDQKKVRAWMASKPGCTKGKDGKWTGCEKVVDNAVKAATDIYNKACTGDNANNAHCTQSDAYLDWVQIVGPGEADTQIDLVWAGLTSLEEPWWGPYAVDDRLTFFDRMVLAKDKDLPSPDGRPFGPDELDQDLLGEFACVAREVPPDTQIICGQVTKRNKDTYQVGTTTVTAQELKDKEALIMQPDKDDTNLRDRSEGFVTFIGRGGLVFGNDLDAGSFVQYGFKAGGRFNSLEIAGVASLVHLPTGGARDSSGPRSFGYRSAFAPGISVAWAPWFKQNFGIALGAEVLALISNGAIGINGTGFFEARWRFGAQKRGLIGVGFLFGRTAMMKDVGIPKVVNDLQVNVDPAARKQNQWVIAPAISAGINF